MRSASENEVSTSTSPRPSSVMRLVAADAVRAGHLQVHHDHVRTRGARRPGSPPRRRRPPPPPGCRRPRPAGCPVRDAGRRGRRPGRRGSDRPPSPGHLHPDGGPATRSRPHVQQASGVGHQARQPAQPEARLRGGTRHDEADAVVDDLEHGASPRSVHPYVEMTCLRVPDGVAHRLLGARQTSAAVSGGRSSASVTDTVVSMPAATAGAVRSVRAARRPLPRRSGGWMETSSDRRERRLVREHAGRLVQLHPGGRRHGGVLGQRPRPRTRSRPGPGPLRRGGRGRSGCARRPRRPSTVWRRRSRSRAARSARRASTQMTGAPSSSRRTGPPTAVIRKGARTSRLRRSRSDAAK